MLSTCHVVARTDDGPILHLAFAGNYPDGSSGNSVASQMRTFTATAVTKHNPAGVVFDLTDVVYRFGDAICGIALPLRRPDGRFISARLLVRGKTADALTPLLGPTGLFGVAGVSRSDSLEAAVAELV